MSRVGPAGKVPIAAMVGLLAALLVALQLGGSEPGLLYLAPALLLVIPLAFGRYPGEWLLAAVSGPRRRGRSKATANPPSTPSRPFPRGGVLLALALAGRGPPARALRPVGTTVERKEPMKLKSILALLALLALAIPASAGAHVTLQPSEAAAGDFTVLDVRVPNERDDAATTKVAVQLPTGFVFASYQPVPGWTVQVKMQKLAEPVQSDDGTITSEVREMTWTADGKGVEPGQFQDFPISVQIPGEAGDTLTFKALQTYDDGEVVRWIGGPDSEEPAPQVAVTASSEGHHGAPAVSSESDDPDGASKGLGIAALVLGALGLLAGGAALARSRRTA